MSSSLRFGGRRLRLQAYVEATARGRDLLIRLANAQPREQFTMVIYDGRRQPLLEGQIIASDDGEVAVRAPWQLPDGAYTVTVVSAIGQGRVTQEFAARA